MITMVAIFFGFMIGFVAGMVCTAAVVLEKLKKAQIERNK